MPRATNSVASRRRRKKILKQTKGYFGARSNVYTVAKNALEKGMTYAYRDRRKKKGNFRALWIQRINAAARQHDMSYSEFIGKVNKKGILLNRKVLADLAMNHPKAFEAIVMQVKDVK
jgi:large subunit ribosomal protein L20